MGKVFTHKRRVEFRDTDAAGIVHFSVFFAYMEQAEHEWWRSLGLSVVQRDDGRITSWPRVGAKCDYKQSIRFEQEISVDLRVARIGTKSLTLSFDFRREDTLVAAGELTTVCCELGPERSMKSIEIPAPIRTAIEEFYDSAAQA